MKYLLASMFFCTGFSAFKISSMLIDSSESLIITAIGGIIMFFGGICLTAGVVELIEITKKLKP